ncbi:hypothetical protein RHGRI_012821 [Rhododendron griersonianum]|uniref:Uncharacterized protein n=1 Tax=Rhododendron griersonianum TaxID=479676 RepID=A0AAV6KSK0_9ERIC|nr:hypothetical protein RHGRI_012821 [Rhododendron griersonianum]
MADVNGKTNRKKGVFGDGEFPQFPLHWNTLSSKMTHFWFRQMLFFLVPATNLCDLECNDSFFFRGLDLRYDVIVNPKNGDGNPSSPFIPKCGHTTLDCDESGSP